MVCTLKIALLTEILEKDGTPTFGSLDKFALELAHYCEQHGILFFVYSLKSSFEQKGFLLLNNRWIKSTVPLPNVVYNRIHSRKIEQSQLFNEYKQMLLDNFISIFNDHFLNKWEVHQLLEQTQYITPYLPETKLLMNKHCMEEMITKHDCVFIKPIHGSLGRKIFRVTRGEGHHFFLDYTSYSSELDKSYTSYAALYQALRVRLARNQFIVQQGLALCKYDNRILDFRILCQKTITDEWKITAMVARVTPYEHFVSNLAQGGEQMRAAPILTVIFGKREAQQIIKIIAELALEIATIISSYCDGIYAELGIDIGVDFEGKPWIIEVNTKPSKNQMEQSGKIRPSAKAVIQHCIYLTGRTMKPTFHTIEPKIE